MAGVDRINIVIINTILFMTFILKGAYTESIGIGP
jgi:hypothetical protein